MAKTMSYIALKCLLYPVGILPRWALRLLSDAMAFVIFRIAGYRKSVVMSNLRRCFPHKSEAELCAIACGSYRSLCDTMLNLLRIRFASEKRILRSVKYLNPEELTMTENQDGIVFAGHYSCWEYMGISQRWLRQHQTIAAYQPSHGALDKIMTQARMRYGAKMTALSATFRTLFEYRNKNSRTYTLMVTDQSPSASECRFFLTFLGQPTPVFITPERIAQKMGSKVLYLRVREIKRFSYEYEFVPLSQNAGKESEEYAVTRRFYAELEKDILRCPPLWIWQHRRWKHVPSDDTGAMQPHASAASPQR